MRFQSGEADENERSAFDRWLHASEMHGAAWEHAEELMRLFGKTPPELGHATLHTVARRRRGLPMLGVMMALLPLAEMVLRGESGSA